MSDVDFMPCELSFVVSPVDLGLAVDESCVRSAWSVEVSVLADVDVEADCSEILPLIGC